MTCEWVEWAGKPLVCREKATHQAVRFKGGLVVDRVYYVCQVHARERRGARLWKVGALSRVRDA